MDRICNKITGFRSTDSRPVLFIGPGLERDGELRDVGYSPDPFGLFQLSIWTFRPYTLIQIDPYLECLCLGARTNGGLQNEGCVDALRSPFCLPSGEITRTPLPLARLGFTVWRACAVLVAARGSPSRDGAAWQRVGRVELDPMSSEQPDPLGCIRMKSGVM